MVELLAPAGNMECLLAALHAGADAVYIGGEKFGARAYAENFTQQDVLHAIDTVHLHQKKLYLTVNTLIKESEFSQLVPYLIPFYEAGLDGVIVQDLGALSVMRREFPQMELHASTQMTVTGSYGASLLKEQGICRVVPARELSLQEIRQIKKDTGLSIETFIHGAMCYAYSGQCLFSSMLGQRSGNRGRCAGPCRLPYQAFCDGKRLNDSNSLYQLSLKDLCSLDILPQLIEAGIDSFKIEGRMKSREYVSFVTGLYRSYIDAYYADARGYRVDEKDKQKLRQTFSRGSLETGYYFMHNGRKLVTLQKPGYQSFTAEETFTVKKSADVKKDTFPVKAVSGENTCMSKLPLDAYFSAHIGEKMSLTVLAGNGLSVTVTGENVEKAVNRPTEPAEIKKALSKTGNTPFEIRSIEVETKGDVFLANKSLNVLRRNALEQLSERMLSVYRRTHTPVLSCMPARSFTEEREKRNLCTETGQIPVMHVRVENLQQFLKLNPKTCIRRIYLSSDCLTEPTQQFAECEAAFLRACVMWKKQGTELFLALPPICRRLVIQELDKRQKKIDGLPFDGYLVNNLESLQYIRAHIPDAKVVSDSRFYVMNFEAARFLEGYGVTEHMISFELHEKEIRQLISACHKETGIRHRYYLPVYGYIPVMESAGCILQTNGACRKEKDAVVTLVDRQNKTLRVLRHCGRCENSIYHTYPLSLHKELDRVMQTGAAGILLSFTWESAKEMNRLVDWYLALLEAAGDRERTKTVLGKAPFVDFTKGHFAKSVE